MDFGSGKTYEDFTLRWTCQLGETAERRVSGRRGHEFRHPQIMTRPCFLVVDREYSQSISTRKLVIETAKFNVITSYSATEALDTLRRFPAVDGVVIDADMADMSCPEFIGALRELAPTLPVIGISAPRVGACQEADYQLESFDPRRLLDLLEKLRPQEAAAVERRNEQLMEKERKLGE
jgi:DNA-binding NtrC family response regulator